MVFLRRTYLRSVIIPAFRKNIEAEEITSAFVISDTGLDDPNRPIRPLFNVVLS